MKRPDPTHRNSVPRGVALQSALQGRTERALRELHSFWEGRQDPPDTTEALIGDLHRRMSSEKIVRKRVRFLSKKLVDLLKFFLRGESCRTDLDHIHGSKTFSYLSPFELKAAVNALLKRGFLFAAGGNGNGAMAQTYHVPSELADVLQAFVWDDERTVEDTITLGGHLSRLVDRQHLSGLLDTWLDGNPTADTHAQAAARLADPSAVHARLAGIPSERQRALLETVVTRFGGLATRADLKTVDPAFARFGRAALQRDLEQALLGTVRHLSLGEYGIHLFDETVVVFEEVVPALLTCLHPDPPRLDSVRGLGVDLISDISTFLSHVEHNPVKLTLSGKVYRTAVRKVEDAFILSGSTGFGGAWLFEYLFDFSLAQDMIERGADRTVALTIKGRSWDRTPLQTKLSRLLRFSVRNWTHATEPFHGDRLLQLYLDRIRELEVGRWVDIHAPAWAARNRYLAQLDRFGVREQFQSRYQFAQQAGMRDPHQLALALTQWARERLFLFGLLDIGEVDGNPAYLRLTPLGAQALGVDVPEAELDRSAPITVNPDFEVILFPDGSSYDLITALDRFAQRLASDPAYRYRITEASVEKAVAAGADAPSILRTLSEHSRTAVPQNVIYSICQWAEKVKFVTQADVSLVRGRNKEVIDRLLHDPRFRPHVLERLSPTAVVIDATLRGERLAALLKPLGVFLEGADG